MNRASPQTKASGLRTWMKLTRFREGGRAECARHLPCPLAPLWRTVSLELGLEGCFPAPSRPIPNIRADAAGPFFCPLARALVGGVPVIVGGASSGASGPGQDANFQRTKCRTGGISSAGILPEPGGIHKAILKGSIQIIAFIFRWLRMAWRRRNAGICLCPGARARV